MNKTSLQIIPGPLASKVSREQAEEGLKNHPRFPKGASYTLETVEGRWVAAIVGQEKTAAPPPFLDDTGGGPPAPSPDDGPPIPEDEGPPTPPDEEEEKPKKDEGGEKGGKGLEHEVAQLTALVQKLVSALGLDGPGPGEGPVPGPDEGPPPPPPGPPGAKGGPGDKTHTVHERALKPGEAPPGSTPVGAPSFASVQIPDEHPWKEFIGKARTFTVGPEAIGNEKLSAIKDELNALGKPYGYYVDQMFPGENEHGQRTASALITNITR